jgi:hypothetical protein
MSGLFSFAILVGHLSAQGTTPATVAQLPSPLQATTPAATAMPAATAAPTIVSAKLNESFTLGSLQYQVVKVTPGLSSYLLQHDQRGARLTPGYKTDRLVVVDVEVTNPSAMPAAFTGLSPALVDSEGAMTNHAQWDVRQQSFVRATGESAGAAMRFDYSTSTDDNGSYGDASGAVMVAPGGHVRFALIFSEPAKVRPGGLRFDTTQPYGGASSFVGVVSLQ